MLVEHIEHQGNNHVLAPVVLPHGAKGDNDHAIKELPKRSSSGRVFHEHLGIDKVVNDGKRCVGLSSQDRPVLRMHIVDSRHPAHGSSGVVSFPDRLLELVALDGPNAREDLV